MFCTSEYVCYQKPYLSTWSVLTNQISDFVGSNYKFSLSLRAEAPNKPIWTHVEIIGTVTVVRAVKLNMWTNEVRAKNPFHLTQV